MVFSSLEKGVLVRWRCRSAVVEENITSTLLFANVTLSVCTTGAKNEDSVMLNCTVVLIMCRFGTSGAEGRRQDEGHVQGFLGR